MSLPRLAFNAVSALHHCFIVCLSHLHILPIFQTEISPELMQVFANGKRRFDSFMEFYVIHLKYQGVKI